MKKLKSLTVRICFMLFAITAAFVSCKKDESQKSNKLSKVSLESNLQLENLNEIQKPSIDILKAYMAERINTSISEIVYDVETQQFLFRGVNQFSKEDLTESYLHNGPKANNK